MRDNGIGTKSARPQSFCQKRPRMNSMEKAISSRINLTRDSLCEASLELEFMQYIKANPDKFPASCQERIDNEIEFLKDSVKEKSSALEFFKEKRRKYEEKKTKDIARVMEEYNKFPKTINEHELKEIKPNRR